MNLPTPPSDLVAHAAFVRRLAGHLLGAETDADDAAQDTYVRALQRPPPRSGGRPWLAAVLRNVVRQGHRTELRRGRREQVAGRPERVPATDDLAARNEVLRAVTNAIDALDAPSREVVFLRHYEELPPREIAKRLALAVETVKSRLKRAHERLRRTLDERAHGDARSWRSALGALVGPAAAAPTAPPTAPLGEITAMSASSKLAVGIAAGALLVGGVAWVGVRGSASAEQALGGPPNTAAVVTVVGTPPPELAAQGGSPPFAPAEPSNGPPVEGGLADGARPTDGAASRPPLMTADEARRGLAVLLQERLRVEALLVAGIEALAADKLPEALDAARAALKEEPDNAKALELEKAALHLQRSEPSAAALAAQKEPFLGWLADLRRTARLEERLLKWPSMSFWTRLAALRAAPKAPPPASAEAYLRTVVAEAVITGTFENAPLSDVLRSLEAQTAVEFLIDSELAASVPAPTVRRLEARILPLGAALDAIAADGGLAWKVAGDVVRIIPRAAEGRAGRSGAPLVTRYYDVSDLLAPKNPNGAFSSIDAIRSRIRAEVEPSLWGDVTRAELEATGQTLVVKAPTEVHAGVAAWLAKQR